MFQSYINAYKNLLDFTGKTDRKAFWEFYAIHAVIAIVFFVLNKRLEAIYLALALLPVLSISARRLRDAGFHALLTLLYFVPVVGWIPLWIMWAQISKPAANHAL
ncbi:DUF805 domain-containing protein (plasmid) [Pseudomonas sp. Leaf58]|uniref:DUF805 domain-containing protein n=1 Tax=unclassified Pseudomonas TaxID=196821 RepID=UPI0006FE7D99|nr:DUF805 domain-containing protein [Pseudomonas sp. Leaf58]AYG47749.1 DUF805 domain-containing protein [Pseudomonas sp. Leaf58]KQN62686.1 hypothetical protein ASF02_11100 [Pseudomonas sp. Leaf58]